MIAKKYSKVSKIGEGKFGEVFRGTYQKTGAPVAIKIEKSNSPIKMIKHEASLLNYLYSKGCRTTPIVYWYGLADTHPTMIIPFYEMSLSQWITNNQGLSQTLDSKKRLMIQMIDILDTIHSNFIIHRDIKPDNFMLRDNNTSVVLIDFGLATVYVDDAKDPMPLSKNTSSTILGTPKYISIHIHAGLDPGRRDDLISLGYIWLFLENDGYLPWENLPTDSNDSSIYPEIHVLHYKNKERARLKLLLLQGTNANAFSKTTIDYLEETYALEYTDCPRYEIYKELFC